MVRWLVYPLVVLGCNCLVCGVGGLPGSKLICGAPYNEGKSRIWMMGIPVSAVILLNARLLFIWRDVYSQ